MHVHVQPPASAGAVKGFIRSIPPGQQLDSDENLFSSPEDQKKITNDVVFGQQVRYAYVFLHLHNALFINFDEFSCIMYPIQDLNSLFH